MLIENAKQDRGTKDTYLYLPRFRRGPVIIAGKSVIVELRFWEVDMQAGAL